MKWWLIVFSLSLCPVCKAPFHFQQQFDAKTITAVYQGGDDTTWFKQWILVRCDKCNNAFYAQADTIVRYTEELRPVDVKGPIRKYYDNLDTTVLINPRLAKK